MTVKTWWRSFRQPLLRAVCVSCFCSRLGCFGSSVGLRPSARTTDVTSTGQSTRIVSGSSTEAAEAKRTRSGPFLASKSTSRCANDAEASGTILKKRSPNIGKTLIALLLASTAVDPARCEQKHIVRDFADDLDQEGLNDDDSASILLDASSQEINPFLTFGSSMPDIDFSGHVLLPSPLRRNTMEGASSSFLRGRGSDDLVASTTASSAGRSGKRKHVGEDHLKFKTLQVGPCFPVSGIVQSISSLDSGANKLQQVLYNIYRFSPPGSEKQALLQLLHSLQNIDKNLMAAEDALVHGNLTGGEDVLRFVMHLATDWFPKGPLAFLGHSEVTFSYVPAEEDNATKDDLDENENETPGVGVFLSPSPGSGSPTQAESRMVERTGDEEQALVSKRAGDDLQTPIRSVPADSTTRGSSSIGARDPLRGQICVRYQVDQGSWNYLAIAGAAVAGGTLWTTLLTAVLCHLRCQHRRLTDKLVELTERRVNERQEAASDSRNLHEAVQRLENVLSAQLRGTACDETVSEIFLGNDSARATLVSTSGLVSTPEMEPRSFGGRRNRSVLAYNCMTTPSRSTLREASAAAAGAICEDECGAEEERDFWGTTEHEELEEPSATDVQDVPLLQPTPTSRIPVRQASTESFRIHTPNLEQDFELLEQPFELREPADSDEAVEKMDTNSSRNYNTSRGAVPASLFPAVVGNNDADELQEELIAEEQGGLEEQDLYPLGGEQESAPFEVDDVVETPLRTPDQRLTRTVMHFSPEAAAGADSSASSSSQRREDYGDIVRDSNPPILASSRGSPRKEDAGIVFPKVKSAATRFEDTPEQTTSSVGGEQDQESSSSVRPLPVIGLSSGPEDLRASFLRTGLHGSSSSRGKYAPDGTPMRLPGESEEPRLWIPETHRGTQKKY
ncbi:unnamed protein product [Amoebophrya sp. A25]|nr:unnamed protein product [Amoebophrya sp. A25]|eukprot:GSA25T00018801001.1